MSKKTKRFFKVLDEAIWRGIVKPVGIGIGYIFFMLYIIWAMASAFISFGLLTGGLSPWLVWNSYIFLAVCGVLLLTSGITCFVDVMKEIGKEMEKEEENKKKNVESILYLDELKGIQDLLEQIKVPTITKTKQADG